MVVDDLYSVLMTQKLWFPLELVLSQTLVICIVY